MNGEHFECFLFIERRQDAREAASEHRFAGARWPHQQQIVRTGRRDFEGAYGQ